MEIFKNSGSHLQVLGVRRAVLSKFHAEESQRWSDLWNSPFSVLLAWCMWTDTHFCVTQNSVTHKTRWLAFGHPWDNLLQGTCIHAGSVFVPTARYK